MSRYGIWKWVYNPANGQVAIGDNDDMHSTMFGWIGGLDRYDMYGGYIDQNSGQGTGFPEGELGDHMWREVMERVNPKYFDHYAAVPTTQVNPLHEQCPICKYPEAKPVPTPMGANWDGDLFREWQCPECGHTWWEQEIIPLHPGRTARKPY